MFHRTMLLVVAFSVVGCVSKSNEVRTRASFDLGCPGDQLAVTALTSEAMETATYGVQGCSKKATYIYTPGAGAVLNSPVQSAGK
ncbi:Hypothetical protein A7982_08165 [Minicystis rosea]|nr:Hypothetical protein A7982_08165 [Minicystis rosea]